MSMADTSKTSHLKKRKQINGKKMVKKIAKNKYITLQVQAQYCFYINK